MRVRLCRLTYKAAVASHWKLRVWGLAGQGSACRVRELHSRAEASQTTHKKHFAADKTGRHAAGLKRGQQSYRCLLEVSAEDAIAAVAPPH